MSRITSYNVCYTKLLRAATKKYRENEYVILAGDLVNDIGIILSGSVEIRKDSLTGASHLLSILHKGELFGEGIVSTADRISKVSVAVREPSVILFLPYETTIQTCSKVCSFHLQLIQNLMMILSEKNASLTQKIELLFRKGMREKLAAYLLMDVITSYSIHYTKLYEIFF